MRSITAARAAAALVVLPLLGACAARTGVPGPIVTDRPDFTESAETVPPGTVQVEGGVTVGEVGDARSTSYGEVLVRAAMGPRAELRVEVPSYVTLRDGGARASGWEDAGIGAKLRLFVPEDDASALVPTTAVIVATSLPTGSRAFRADHAVLGATLTMAWELGARAGLGVNASYTRPTEGDARTGEFNGSVAIGTDLTERLGLFLEGYGFAPQQRGAGRPAYVDGGLTFRLTPDFQLDGRVGVGVGDADGERFVGVGVSRRF